MIGTLHLFLQVAAVLLLNRLAARTADEHERRGKSRDLRCQGDFHFGFFLLFEAEDDVLVTCLTMLHWRIQTELQDDNE